MKCEAYFTGVDRIYKVVNWKNIEALLKELVKGVYYEVGTSKYGADA
jgi:hypothetical protein